MSSQFRPPEPGFDDVRLDYLDADSRGTGGGQSKSSLTVDEVAVQLTRDSSGWAARVGVAATVTYAYRAEAPAQMPDDTGGFQRFNSAQIAQTEQAMASWSDVANIRFVRVGSGAAGEAAYSNNATILLGNYTTGESGSAAFAYFPGSTAANSAAGDVWINVNATSNSYPAAGNYGAQVLTHELGHTIGLSHPADYNASATGAAITYADNATYFEDTRQYTIMSYFAETNSGARFSGTYGAVPMLDDISAAQRLYGANLATRVGDTVYGFNSNADRAWFVAGGSASKLVFAVWDAGGHDTFDFSGYSQNQQIDLREGYFSDVGGLEGNIAIAKGASIEDAIGGSGSDTIDGNALANVLTGNAGSDLIHGGAGADTIFGGADNDTIDGGEGTSYLRGEEGADSIVGGAAFDDIQGNTGNDTERGGDGNDYVVGGKDDDVLYGEGGADLVYGNIGADSCDGGAGNDIVRGGKDDDVLFGSEGNDFLSGDLGSDTMVGGAGADIFHTFAGTGSDQINDFSIADGDRVLLDPGTVFKLMQVGENALITFDGTEDRVILIGVNLEALPTGWIYGY